MNENEEWLRWAKSHPDGVLYIHYRYKGSTAENTERLGEMAARLRNVKISPPRRPAEEHCNIPKLHWKERIEAALPPAAGPH